MEIASQVDGSYLCPLIHPEASILTMILWRRCHATQPSLGTPYRRFDTFQRVQRGILSIRGYTVLILTTIWTVYANFCSFRSEMPPSVQFGEIGMDIVESLPRVLVALSPISSPYRHRLT
jgi:hypothetical protein